ncbi:MAG: hypothetical protein PHW21_05555 [Candidatus Izemoplasmatales bacterium]|nr:hypothetical protein [Candidatus Izemoplasmatales bacterium]
MKAKQNLLIISVILFLLGLFMFLTDLVSDYVFERLEMLFFAFVLLGGYGITKYFYDK